MSPVPELPVFAIQVWVLAVLQSVDLAFTLNLYYLEALGELNPIANLVIGYAGGFGLILYKLIVICGVVTVMWVARTNYHRLVVRSLLVCNTASMVVVAYGILANVVYYRNI